MKSLKYSLHLIQFVILVVLEVNSKQIFFRGKFFDVESDNTVLRAGDAVQEKWHSQKLDHFNSTITKLWSQRYYINEQYYGKQENNPIFLMLGSEANISASWMTGGFWVNRAQQHQALLLQLEHRFYGKSHPTKDASTANLQYLTVEQALEDTVHFIKSMKETYKLQNSNRWILFGCSYAGNLVAWLRLKFPDLIYGGISSSSPVLSVVDYKDYYRAIAESLAMYSSSCVTKITEAFSSINKLSHDAKGKQYLTKKFNLCKALEKSKDFTNDFSQLNNALAYHIAGVVQKNKVNHKSNQTIGIDQMCKILENKELGSTTLDRFAALTKVLLNSQNLTCLEYNYRNYINYFRATSWDHGANKGARQWFFQTCNQLGYFQTSSNEPHVFGNKFPVEQKIRQCMDIFGPLYTARFIEKKIGRTNKVYGGKDIVNNVDRVVFVQGSMDPWHALGVTNSSNPRSPALYIIGAGHCADTLNSNQQDLPQLTAARKTIGSYIRAWLL